MSDIGQWDRPALEQLMERGAMTAAEIAEAVGIDQFGRSDAEAWVGNALDRELVEETGGSGSSTRYNITDDGRRAIGVPTGR